METQLNYIQELERQLDNPETSQMKELIGNQQLRLDSQRAELLTVKDSSVKNKLDNALIKKQNGLLVEENEALLKQAKRYKQELLTMERQMRNMVNSHKNELKSMETDKDERIRILHEDITDLNRERCQIEDELAHKLGKSKNRIHQLKVRLSKSSSKYIM